MLAQFLRRILNILNDILYELRREEICLMNYIWVHKSLEPSVFDVTDYELPLIRIVLTFQENSLQWSHVFWHIKPRVQIYMINI